MFFFEKPKFFPTSIKFCDWWKKAALVKIKTYPKREKDKERKVFTPVIITGSS